MNPSRRFLGSGSLRYNEEAGQRALLRRAHIAKVTVPTASWRKEACAMHIYIAITIYLHT